MCQVVGNPSAPGTALKARVLDVSKDTGIVDVTLKPDLIKPATAATVTTKGQTDSAQTDKGGKKSKKRKAAEALDAAHANDHVPQVSVFLGSDPKP